MRNVSYFLFYLLASFQVLAQSETDSHMDSEDPLLEDMPVVLSASRLAQPLNESPVAMTIIDRDMIEASGARSIPDILRLVPGFQVGHFDGNSPVATYHGHGVEHVKQMQVLIDGRSVYLPSLNAVPWSDLILEIDDIERIEVIRGPNASTYGNNSFLAVISITTRYAIESQGHYLKTTTGSHGTRDAIYQFGDQIDNLDYRVTLASHNDDGTDFLRDETASDSFSYRIDYQASSKDYIQYQGGIKNIKLGDHESVPGEDQLTGHNIENESAYQHIKWEHHLESGNSLSLQYYYNLNSSLEVSPPVAVDLSIIGINPFNFVSVSDIKTQRHDLEFNHFIQPSENLRLVWGASTRLDMVKALGIFDDESEQKLHLSRLFAHGEWRLAKNWLFNAGYMIENNDISGQDSSPRLALIHHINNNHTLRLGYSEATRTPTLFEESGNLIYRQQEISGPATQSDPFVSEVRFTRLIAPGNLDSEKITSRELGYIGEFVNSNLLIDIKLFEDKIRDLITFNSTPLIPSTDTTILELNDPAYGFSGQLDIIENSLQSVSRGIETSINYQLDKNLRIYGIYAYINIDDKGTSQELEISAPTNSSAVLIIKQWPDSINTSLGYYRVNNMEWTDRDDDNAAEAYSKLDLRIAKTFYFGNERMEVSMLAQNLAGDYYDYYRTSYTGNVVKEYGSLQDKRFYLDLSIKFN